jgi:glycosyltransferase involved in cell wall biosynthesis
MRIVLDLQGAQSESRVRGIGRYTLSLAKAIIRQRGDHEVLVALSDLYPDTVDPIRGSLDGILAQGDIRVWQAAGPVGAAAPGNDWRRATARKVREAFLAGLEPDVVHISNILPGQGQDVVASIGTFASSFASVATVYDLIPLANPADYLTPYPRFERFYLNNLESLKQAQAWLAISEWSKAEVIDRLKLNSALVTNVSTGCDPDFRELRVSAQDEACIRGRFGVVRPFVMYSGGSDARKNLRRLIQAYALLPTGLRLEHQLLLVGSIPPEVVADLQAAARIAGIGSNDLKFTGYVSDEDLILLYNLCRLFVLPSIHEGFGMPALEAVTCGAAVIGANATSLPEVIGWPEALFDPLDVGSIASKMSRALADDRFRCELIARGRVQAKRFSWDESGKRALIAFEDVQSRREPKRAPTSSGAMVRRLANGIRMLEGTPHDQDLLRTARAIGWNHPGSDAGRLLVDVSVIAQVDAGSGIQRVVRNLLTALPGQLGPRELQPVYATADRRGYRLARFAAPGNDDASPVIATEEVLEPRPSDMFLGLDLGPEVVAAQAGYFKELRRLGIPVSFVVYDLLPVLLPDRFPPNAERRHIAWLEVVSSADGALCISRSVADELRSWIGAREPGRNRPFRIGWFHLAAEIGRTASVEELPSNAITVLQNLRSRPTFILVGTLEPRKGHAQALAAFERLWNEHADVNLVFVGKQGWKVDPLVRRLRSHPELGKRLYWLDRITDRYLQDVYRAAACLISASEGEGYGLPLIEAARVGTPILAREIPVLREIAGDHAYYFTGSDADSLEKAVRRWLALWRQGRHPRPDGITQLTWDQSAAQVIGILQGDRRYIRLSPTHLSS